MNIKVIILIVTIIILLILFNVFYFREPFSQIDFENESSLAPKKTYFKIIREILNKKDIPEDTSSFKKMESGDTNIPIKKIEEHLIKNVNSIIQRENGIANLDRNIYDMMYKTSDNKIEIIYNVILVINNTKLGTGDRYFLKVYGTIIGDDINILNIEQDSTKNVNFIGYNYDRDDISLIKDKETVSETLYKREIDKFLELVKILNTDDNLPDYKKEYIRFPFHTKFALNNAFKELLIKNIKGILEKNQEFKDEEIYSQRDLYNIYYSDSLLNRNYIFGFDLFLRKKAINVQLIVNIEVLNVNKFLDNSNNFFPDADQLMNENDIKIKYLGQFKDTQIDSLNIVPTEETNVSDYYTLKNKLHLLYPFEKDSKGMRITKEMREKYNKEISNKPVTIYDIQKLATCYDTDTTYGLSRFVTKTDCETNGGLWDYPPILNNDCPFYEANTNYVNNLGKIIGNSCQMPMNMRLIGHRYFSQSDNYQPLCYNCKDKLINKGTLGYCCEEQKNIEVYPNFTSPDYAFNGDTVFREAATEELKSKNLSLT